MNEGPTHQSLNSHPEIKADFSNQCQQSCSSLIVGEDTVIYSQNHTVFRWGKKKYCCITSGYTVTGRKLMLWVTRRAPGGLATFSPLRMTLLGVPEWPGKLHEGFSGSLSPQLCTLTSQGPGIPFLEDRGHTMRPGSGWLLL